MEVMEQYDSEDDSGGDSLDRYEEDFVLPDNVVYYESGQICDFRTGDENPFGRAPRGQPDSIIRTRDGTVITISWHHPSAENSGDPEESEYEPSDDDDE